MIEGLRESPRVRVAVVGTGVMGRLHARVLQGLGHDVELTGVYDANRAVSAEVAALRGVKSFAREADAIANADLLIVATPISAHASTARRALDAGLSVFVEKPLCARADDALALVRATCPRRHLFVGHSERFNPVVRALRSLVAPFEIRSVDLRRVASSAPRAREHGVILSLAVHDLDLVSFLTRSPIEVVHAAGTGDDSVRLALRSSHGASARIFVDRTAGVRERAIEILTDRDAFSGNLLVPRLTRTSRVTGRSEDVPLPVEEALVAQAVAMVRALRGLGPTDIATGADGASVLHLAERAIDELGSGAAAHVSAAS